MKTKLAAFRHDIAKALYRHLSGIPAVPVMRRHFRVSATSLEELYRIGSHHYFWISVYVTLGEPQTYRAIVTRARRTTSPVCKECVLCLNADDVAAAMAAEVRTLHPLS